MTRLDLGTVSIARAVAHTLPPELVLDLIARHAAADWGEAGQEQCRKGEFSLWAGFRFLTEFHTPYGEVWIITAADHSSTVVVFPDDY